MTTRVISSLMEFSGEMIGFMVIVKNKISYEAIHEYQLQNNPILRAINSRKDLVWMVAEARSGHYLFCSDSFQEITGWSPMDFSEGGRAFSFSIFHPTDRERCYKAIADWSFKTNQNKPIYNHLPLIIQTFRLKHKNGQWVQMTGEANVLERDSNNNVKLVLWSFRRLNGMESEKKGLGKIQDFVKFIDGKPYVNLDFLKQLRDKSLKTSKQHDQSENFGLTDREMEVLKLIADGLSSEEIAIKIFISKNTVNLHRKQILRKMKVNNLAQLIRKSIENGLV